MVESPASYQFSPYFRNPISHLRKLSIELEPSLEQDAAMLPG